MDNVLIAHRLGSIDLGAPAPRPFGLRLPGPAPAGRVPAGDIARHTKGLANLMVVRSIGSIDLGRRGDLTLRGYVYPAQLPLAVFPPET